MWSFIPKNKFEKLVHLVGFIIRIYHDARSPERQILSTSSLVTFNISVPTSKATHCASNTKINHPVILIDITAVFFDNHDQQIPDTFGRKHVECVNVKESGTHSAVTAVLGKV